MIQSKEELRHYIECDLRSLNMFPLSQSAKMGGGTVPLSAVEASNQIKKA